MRVLKVVVEGQTTSFRYPHFMQQVHPTYPMPPPATIYGHICSALGEWFNPTEARFAYHFTSHGIATDVEHIITLVPATGTLLGTSVTKVLEGNVTPFSRDLLFRPRLVLYLDRPDWEPAFRSPRHAVVLGRSQDLCTYMQIDVIDLQQADRAYFEHTLLPHAMALQVGRGMTLLMPRFLDWARNRAPAWQRYLVLEDRVHLPKAEGFQFEEVAIGPFWIDPTSVEDKGAHLGLVFHSFVEETDGAKHLA
jgi:CRISPR-associated protein Cas5t